jgi:glucan endo-1,3-alpha-glucosidase
MRPTAWAGRPIGNGYVERACVLRFPPYSLISSQTQDYLWAVVMLTAPASVTLSCGTSTLSVSIPSGVSQLKLPLKMDCEVRATVSRNGVKAIDFTPSGFSFRTRPPSYNFNAFVAASP